MRNIKKVKFKKKLIHEILKIFENIFKIIYKNVGLARFLVRISNTIYDFKRKFK